MSSPRLRIAGTALLIAVALGGVNPFGSQSLPSAVAADPVRSAARPGVDLYGDPLPAGALARLGTVRFRGRSGQSHGLAFLPDGNTLVTADGDSAIRFWETNTGRLLREVRVSPLSVRTFALSPDGKQIAVGGYLLNDKDDWASAGAVRILDAASGKEVRSFSRTDRDVDHSIRFTPDGKFLVSLGGQGVVRIEEIASGTELLQQKFPGDVGAEVAVSPDGKTLAVWSGPNTRRLYLWDWQGGQEPRQVKVPRDRVGHLCFSPDGKVLAATAGYEAVLLFWDVASGRLQRQLDLRDDISLGGLTFRPDGRALAVSDMGNRVGRNWSGAVFLLERDTGKVLREMPTRGESVAAVVFSPDGRWLAAGGGGGVRVWDSRSGQEVEAGAAGHHGMVGQVAATADGLVATASDDHTVRVWDAATGKQRWQLEHGHWVRAAAVSPDGRLLVSSSLDDFVHLWDLRTGKEIYRLPGHGAHGGNRAVGFTPDGKHFLSWGDDFYLRTWDVRTGKALAEHAVRPPGVKVPDEDADVHGRERMMMMVGPGAVSPDGKRLVAAVYNSFHIIDTATGRVEHTLEGPGDRVLSLAVSPDGRLFASSAGGKTIQTKLPDGRTRFSTPNHHLVCVGELATGKLVKRLEMPSRVTGPVAFSSDSKLLAVGFGWQDGEIRLLNLANDEPAAVLTRFGASAHALAFSPDGKYLIAALDDASGLVWDLAGVLRKKP
jgi:WD40 repeat protein